MARPEPLPRSGAIGGPRPFTIPLGDGPEPDRVIPQLAGRDHPAALWGQWFGGGALLLHAPLRTLTPATAAEAFDTLDEDPRIEPVGDDILGGGWLCCLGFDPGTTWLGCYDHLLRWRPGHGWRFEALGSAGREQAYVEALGTARAMLSSPPLRADPPRVGAFVAGGPVAAARQQFLAAVEAGVGRIRQGAFYQINLATRLRASFDGDSAALFARAAGQLRPAYGALVPGPAPVVSLSPELFLRVHDGRVTTAPIKGTTPSTSAAAAARLRVSTKDAAENVMIVDLMRNDLSRVARPGTVVVDELLEVQPHVGVSHLVSRVSAELQPQVGVGALLRAAFPPGSVTGAPKASALRGIADLEGQPRGAYTGAVGFATPVAGAEFSVLIRSFEVSGSSLELGVGGGITVDSVPVREWRECLDKAAPLIRAAGSDFDPALIERASPDRAAQGVLETLLARHGRILRLADHVARLDRSCRELYGAGLSEDLAGRLQAAATAHASCDRLALRVEVDPAGDLATRVSVRELGAPLRRSTLRYAIRQDISWRHKWRDRHDLEAAEWAVAGDWPEGSAEAAVVPYFTAAGAVAETSRGNLFCRVAGGRWVTPLLDEAVLPGVTRRAVLDLLQRWGYEVDVVAMDPSTPTSSTGVFWTSSLSGAVSVDAVDGYPLPAITVLVDRLNVGLGVADDQTPEAERLSLAGSVPGDTDPASMTRRADSRKPLA